MSRPIPTSTLPGSPGSLPAVLSSDVKAVADLANPQEPTQFGRYTLLAKLAQGGMAELFVAELGGAAGFSKKVVIKRILPHVAHDEDFTSMFLDEAMTCAQINHPNVCQVFELCEADNSHSHYLVLEHLEGATAGELIRRGFVAERQLDLRLAAGIIVQACDGLHAAHEQVDDEGNNSNLVHRDVSPGNLFVTVDGIVKVLDFGIAKARWMSRKTKTGTLLGKSEYMSPEQARGGAPLDRRSDIFSLGIIAWELVCGQRLFRRESEYETLRAVLRAPIERPISHRPLIPPALDEAIMRALERDPDERFQTAYELRRAIAEALMEFGGPTPMCDIAPVIRSAFATELKLQRAMLREASQKAALGAPARHRLSSVFPFSEDEGPDTEAQTNVMRSPPALDMKAQKEELLSVSSPSAAESPSSTELHVSGASASTVQDRENADTVIAPPAEEANGQVRDNRAGALLLSLILLLGAALATAALILFNKNPREAKGQAATAVIATDAAQSNERVTPTDARNVRKASSEELARGPGSASEASPPSSAAANAAAQAKLLEANRAGHVIVTPLPDHNAESALVGTVEILSSEPGDVYLYPDKALLGTTPLTVHLPTGKHKLKLQIGPGRDQKKYFYIRVEPDRKISRLFDHW